LFVASILILSNQRHQLDVATKQIGQQLNQERQHSAALNEQLQNVLQSLQPAIAMLNLVRPGLQRGALELPDVKLNSGTKALHIEVALSASTPEKYEVQLRNKGRVLWSLDGVDATAVPGGAILKLDVPADVLPEGACELAVKPLVGSYTSYWFLVSKLQ